MKKIIILLVASTVSPAFSQSLQQPMYMQFLAGEMQLSDDTVAVTYDGLNYEGKLDDVPYFGGAAQVILNDGLFGYGWEGGAFVSWKNDNVIYAAQSGPNGSTVNIHFDNEFWAFETFMGLYADFKPANRFRFYFSGGPLVLFGRADREDAEPEPTATTVNGTIIITDSKNSDTDISLGLYARAGADIRITENYWVGLNARYMDSELDLSESLGDFDINGTMYLLSLTARY